MGNLGQPSEQTKRQMKRIQTHLTFQFKEINYYVEGNDKRSISYTKILSQNDYKKFKGSSTPKYFLNPFYLKEIKQQISTLDNCSQCKRATTSTSIFKYGKQSLTDDDWSIYCALLCVFTAGLMLPYLIYQTQCDHQMKTFLYCSVCGKRKSLQFSGD